MARAHRARPVAILSRATILSCIEDQVQAAVVDIIMAWQVTRSLMVKSDRSHRRTATQRAHRTGEARHYLVDYTYNLSELSIAEVIDLYWFMLP